MDNKNSVAITIPVDMIKNTPREELVEMFNDVCDDITDGYFAGATENIATTFIPAPPAKQLPAKEECCNDDCDGCYCEAPCGQSCYDVQSRRDSFQEPAYVDSVQYPTDKYIDKALLSARAAEYDMDPKLAYMVDKMRQVNQAVFSKLQDIHAQEIASLLEYMTQQNIITHQTLIDINNNKK